MDALTTIGLCALLVSQQATAACPRPVAVSSANVEHWQPLIAQAARRFQIPQGWIAAVMARESAGLATLNGKPVTSRAGAMGLMQVMPQTYADLRVRYGFGPDPYDVHDNVLAGAAYLRAMFDRYGYPGLFAAYHAGPGRMDAYLRGEKPLPEATQTYLQNLIRGIKSDSDRAQDPPFFVRRDGENPPSNLARDRNALFVPLGAPAP